MRHQIIIAHRTDTGLERKENEDAICCVNDERNGGSLIVLADGLGGGSCGQIASQLAVQTVRQSFFSTSDAEFSIHDRLALAIAEANRVIHHRSSRDRQCKGMGSTCATLALQDEVAYVAHVGDSRVYLVRDNRIRQLTRDHSRVQRMLDDGLITEDEAASHPERNWLERALGLKPQILPDLLPEPIRVARDDTFLLCTDGLTNLVRDEEIFRMVQMAPAAHACEALIALANERGGTDNITVAIARIGADITLTF
ncbi:MAG: Stp1/IreP family PP2C-type Ser/Thr phosphatase [Acidobacteria bacterium]|nr:Stp1/IreP family PP2C-type Ser/Thr phosphatase [Acidobacteriota bacterium]